MKCREGDLKMRRRLAQRNISLHKRRRGGLKYAALGLGLIILISAPIWILQSQIGKSTGIEKPIHELYPQINNTNTPLELKNQTVDLTFKVTRVIDGDTFEIEIPNYGVDRIRIKNIDTPELRKARCKQEKELAKAATELAHTYLNEKSVSLITDAKRDPYGRTVAFVTLPDGRDYGSLMLASGLAAPWPSKVDWCR